MIKKHDLERPKNQEDSTVMYLHESVSTALAQSTVQPPAPIPAQQRVADAHGYVRGRVRMDFGIPDNFEMDVDVTVPLRDQGASEDNHQTHILPNIGEVGVSLRRIQGGIRAILVHRREKGGPWAPGVCIGTELTPDEIPKLLRQAEKSINWSA